MSECNCNYRPLSFNSCSSCPSPCSTLCCSPNLCDMDCLIANLKSELFSKRQNAKDYCSLEAKVLQLQKEINALNDEKKILECQICETEKEGDKMIFELKNKNDNLKNEIDEKNCLNKKLYGENNNLFQILEGKTCDNENLQEQICHQENILSRLNNDKLTLSNNITNLNQLRDKHTKDIQNLNCEINSLNKDSNELDISLRNRQSQNEQLINECNTIKCMNTRLFNDLKEKECSLAKNQEELFCLKENISRLQSDLNNFNCLNQKATDDISCTNNSLIKEISIKKNLENENTKLNCLINDRDAKIQQVNSDNEILKCANSGNNSDNILLNKKAEAYKKHILILTDQNEKLSCELENIINRDSQLLNTLGRDTYLRAVQYENKNVINSSLDCLQAFSKQKCGLECDCVNKYNDIKYKNNYEY